MSRQQAQPNNNGLACADTAQGRLAAAASEAVAKPLGNDAILRTPPDGYDPQDARRRRFALQRHVSWLLKDMRRKDRKGKLQPYRVNNCMWAQGWQYEGVEASKTTVGASFKRGLQICGSVWHCPVCAARISNERQREIRLAVESAEALGYKTLLVTFTAHHTALTELAEQLAAMTRAYEAVWRGAPADRMKARYGILGMIRSLEATHSRRNGWHPHIHVLMFVR